MLIVEKVVESATKQVRLSLPWKDPLQASIPTLHHGGFAAVYHGQRRRGDFYDFVRASRQRVLFGLFDVAGKLEQSRPILVSIQECFRTRSEELLAQSAANETESLCELWLQLNRTTMKTAGGPHSCPAFIGCYNEQLHTVSYVNAGHTPGLVRNGGSASELRATALPLGLFSHSVPDAGMIALSPGDLILLVSKGVVEARHGREEFGLERVKQYLQEIGFDTPHETCVGLLARLQKFTHTAPTHNDVTTLCLLRSV